MPVNSFDDYYMSWKPDKSCLEKPYYQSLARQLERDIMAGRLSDNTRLPPQRELADFLDLNLSTVTRAYKLCELKGLLYGVTGSGTYVSPGSRVGDTFVDRGGSLIEMGMIKPFYETNCRVLEAARSVLGRRDSRRLFEYGDPLGTERQLSAARLWLEKRGAPVEGDNLMIVAGAQNALSVILLSLFRAGDKIAVDEYTYTNFRRLAGLLQIQLVAVEADSRGMRPEALDALCRHGGVKGIYLMPTCSNPTGLCMSRDRRMELAETVRRYRLLVIEDDIYSFLAPADFQSFFSMAPKNTVHICSLSKSLCAGLRVAYLAFPEQYRETLVSGMLSVNLKTVSLNAEIIAQLIISGEADRIVEEKISLAHARNKIFRNYFPGGPEEVIPRFFHWVRLPGDMTSHEAELLALQKGIHILGSHRFAMGNRDPAHHVRLSIVSPRSEAELEEALGTLRELLGHTPLPSGVQGDRQAFYC
ncbi:MAG: PLP-dependent aminotransferase family protein [Lachnospiraceae bacterium]|nr:PLP-dependent aminotransferase family protein [Lachnospiraceae bacterium]